MIVTHNASNVHGFLKKVQRDKKVLSPFYPHLTLKKRSQARTISLQCYCQSSYYQLSVVLLERSSKNSEQNSVTGKQQGWQEQPDNLLVAAVRPRGKRAARRGSHALQKTLPSWRPPAFTWKPRAHRPVNINDLRWDILHCAAWGSFHKYLRQSAMGKFSHQGKSLYEFDLPRPRRRGQSQLRKAGDNRPFY